MSTEEELRVYKLLARKRLRIVFLTLGLSGVFSLLFMIYGFTQSIEAGRQRDIVEQMRAQMIKCEETAKSQQQQLEQAYVQVEAALQRAQVATVEAARKK